MSITEGPAIDLDKSCPPFLNEHAPFCWRLAGALRELGVNAAFHDNEELQGGKLNGMPGWRQFHTETNDAKELAEHIEREIGKFVLFSRLWIPSGGVMYAGSSIASNVWVRELLVYLPGTDEAIHRYDVIVKSAMSQ